MPAKLHIGTHSDFTQSVLTKQVWRDLKDNSCFGLRQGSLKVNEIIAVEECGGGLSWKTSTATQSFNLICI